MKAVEADVLERAARRKERSIVAEEWKEKGNKEFREGHFEAALECYTQVCMMQILSQLFYSDVLKFCLRYQTKQHDVITIRTGDI